MQQENTSLEFSSFIAIQFENENLLKLKALLDSDTLIFYFKKGNEYFGGPEGSRIVYAKLKSPDEDVTKAWAKEASFMAISLSNLMKDGNPSKRIFYKKDLTGVEVVDKSDIQKNLLKGKNVSN